LLVIAVATICGIIFGPSAAGLFDPHTWGNVDQITLEASRIVLVVQCFAVGVELPKVAPSSIFRSVDLCTDYPHRNIWNVIGSLWSFS